MNRKIATTLLLIAVLLSACAQAQPTAVKVEPMPTSDPAAYPTPGGAAPRDATLGTPYPVSPYPSSPDIIVAQPPVTNPYPADNPNFAPAAGDQKLTRGTVFPDLAGSRLMVMETMPVQVTLKLKGSLPNPCYQLRAEVKTNEAQKRVDVEVYSLVEPGKMCIDVLQPFDVNIPLGSFSGGKFTVYVNGESLGEFDS